MKKFLQVLSWIITILCGVVLISSTSDESMNGDLFLGIAMMMTQTICTIIYLNEQDKKTAKTKIKK